MESGGVIRRSVNATKRNGFRFEEIPALDTDDGRCIAVSQIADGSKMRDISMLKGIVANGHSKWSPRAAR